MFHKVVLIVFLVGISICNDAQTYVRVPANNPNILITGAVQLLKTADSVIINRHSPEFYLKTVGYFNAAKGRTQSGVVISFKTTSPGVKVYFLKRVDAEQRELTFAVYKNKQFVGYQKNTLQLFLESGTDVEVSWDIVLPSFYGVHLAGLEVQEGNTILLPDDRSIKKYIAIGNSITHGTGQTKVASDGTYPFLFSEAMGWELYNLAVGGSRITELIAEETRSIDAHAISILWGYNDWISGQNIVANVIPHYKSLLINLREYHPDAYIYCIMPTATKSLKPNTGNEAPIDTLRNSQRKTVMELIQQGDKKFIIVEGGSMTTFTDLADDVHFNNEGAKTLADSLVSVARKVEGINATVLFEMPDKIINITIQGLNIHIKSTTMMKSVKVINSQGVLIKDKLNCSDNEQISLSAKGIYFIVVGDRNEVVKVVV